MGQWVNSSKEGSVLCVRYGSWCAWCCLPGPRSNNSSPQQRSCFLISRIGSRICCRKYCDTLSISLAFIIIPGVRSLILSYLLKKNNINVVLTTFRVSLLTRSQFWIWFNLLFIFCDSCSIQIFPYGYQDWRIEGWFHVCLLCIKNHWNLSLAE